MRRRSSVNHSAPTRIRRLVGNHPARVRCEPVNSAGMLIPMTLSS